MNALESFALTQARAKRLGWQRAFWHLLALPRKETLPRLAEKWVGEGHVDEAFDLLFEGTQMLPPVRHVALRDYTNMCHWLAMEGRLEEANDRLNRLSRSWRTRNAANRRIAQFFSKHSDLSPANIARVSNLLKRGKPNHNALRALAIATQDMTGLEKLYRGALKKLSPKSARWQAIAHDYVSLFWDQPENRSYVNALAGKLELDFERTSLSQDAGIAAGALTFDGAEEIKIAAEDITALISHGNAAIWERLANRALRIAIVGNSPVLLGQGQGPEIDAHDIVIRFNTAALETDYAADTGIKTDVFVLRQSVFSRDLVTGLHDKDIIVTGPDFYNFTRGKMVACQHLANDCRVGMISKDVRVGLIDLLWGTPSSGISILAAVHVARGSLAGVSTYGFAFTDQVGENASDANFFRANRASPRHSWAGEAALFARMRNGTADAPVEDAEKRRLRYGNILGDPEAFRPLRIKIGGDHASYHCGSRAVTEHMRETLRERGALVRGDEFDVLVMNGEGSMHHDSPAYRNKMAEMRAAVDAGKPVFLVNTVWQDNTDVDIDLLRRLELIQVREAASQRDLAENHGIASTVQPDLSFYRTLQKARPNRKYKGRIVLTDFYAHQFKTFAKWTGAEGLKYPYIDMRATTWSQMVADLRTAEMLITGRHHAVFAACRAELPFIAFAGNTHKISGVFEAAGVNIPMAESRDELPELIDWVRSNRAEYEKLFAWLKSFPKWMPFY